jgi:CO/xanthine dehydrogenase FAD-binding subunit
VEKYKLSELNFQSPSYMSEALELMNDSDGENICILAGGTDVVPRLNSRNGLAYSLLLYLGNLDLNYIKDEKDSVRIGAMAPLTAILESKIISDSFPELNEAVQTMAGVSIRNAGTLGGNVMNASPAADSIPALLVRDAKVVLESVAGQRELPMDEFFTGPGKTAKMKNEILKEIIIPKSEGKSCFIKLGRRKAETLSVVNVCTFAQEINGECKNVRIAMGAVAPTPLRSKKAETMLEGKRVDKALIDLSIAAVLEEIKPIDDTRSTAWYRQKATKALLIKSLYCIFGIEE